jgi:hypothetical protein
MWLIGVLHALQKSISSTFFNAEKAKTTEKRGRVQPLKTNSRLY